MDDSYHFAKESAMPLDNVFLGADFIKEWSQINIFGQDLSFISFTNFPSVV